MICILRNIRKAQGLLAIITRALYGRLHRNFGERCRYVKMGFSFAIGILSVIMAYILGVPLGIMMARNKDKLLDKLGTIYIVFIMAVPSLAYIFIFSAIGRAIGLPTTFSVSEPTTLMYICLLCRWHFLRLQTL